MTESLKTTPVERVTTSSVSNLESNSNLPPSSNDTVSTELPKYPFKTESPT